jgi:hypothetical protein
MSRRLIVAAVFVIAIAVPSAASASVPSDFVGITSEDVFVGDAGYRAANLASQAAIGVGVIRQTFDWSQIETSPGRFELGFYDDYVASAAAHGIGILPVLFNPPAFHRAGSAGRATCPPDSKQSYARFAQTLVRRYGPDGTLWAQRPDVPKHPIRSWQIWNEPNLAIYWCNHSNAARYVSMLRNVGKAIKQVDRGAEIVTAGLPPSKLKSAVPIERFIRQMYKAGGRKAFDTLAINSYAKDRRELGQLLGSIRKQMNRHRDRRARIWVTELGWGDGGPPHRFNLGAAGQASMISKAFSLIARRKARWKLRGVVYFSWRDAAPYPPQYKDMWGLHTGLLDMNAGPKPAFFAFKDAVGRVR